MKKYITGLLIALNFVAHSAYASPAAPQADVDYQLLPGAKPLPAISVDSAQENAPALQKQKNKQARPVVEVMEFFWYGCPHCATLDAKLSVWLKRNGQSVHFKQVPVAFSKDLESHQRLYHTLVAMGLSTSTLSVLNAKIFEEIQVQKNYLLTPDTQAQFLSKHGIDAARFLQVYASDGVTKAVAEDIALTQKYNIDGVPALIIDNQYLTSPAMTGSLDGAVQVLDVLVNTIQSQKAVQ